MAVLVECHIEEVADTATCAPAGRAGCWPEIQFLVHVTADDDGNDVFTSKSQLENIECSSSSSSSSCDIDSPPDAYARGLSGLRASVPVVSVSAVALEARLALPPSMPRGRPPPVLPFELLQKIIQSLDGQNDRPTLLSLLQVSKACWETAARVLYRKVILTKDRTERLFLPGGDDMATVTEKPEQRLVQLCSRTRRALSFIERVEFDSIEEDHVYLLWAATIPDTPLFPSAREVCSRHFRSRFTHLTRYPEKDVPHGVDIFDSIDICVDGLQGLVNLEYLPIKKLKSVNVHGAQRIRRDWREFPDEWEELRCFMEGPQTFALQANDRFDEAEAFLDEVDPDGDFPPLYYVIPTDEWEDLTLANLYEQRKWVPSPTSRIQITFDTADWRAPPCVVCGARYYWPEDTVVGYKGALHWFTGNS